jgi:hypothetical protein
MPFADRVPFSADGAAFISKSATGRIRRGEPGADQFEIAPLALSTYLLDFWPRVSFP